MCLKDWVVTVYGADEKILDTWIIRDRTESNAFQEAEAEIVQMSSVDDWTMMEENNVL